MILPAMVAGSSAMPVLRGLTRSSSHGVVPVEGQLVVRQVRHTHRQLLPIAQCPVVCAATPIPAEVAKAAVTSSKGQMATPGTTTAPQQQQQQQAAAPSSPQPGSRRQPFPARRRPLKPKPYLVRVAGRTSEVAAAAGAVVKRLQTEDQVRVAAIDPESLHKAMIVLTAANKMAQINSGHMLVFQPTLISKSAAEPPRIPDGSMVMYTSQIMAGEVLTFNTLRVTAATEVKPLSKAVIARLASSSHTVMECYGAQALTTAVQAVAEARKGLLIRGQDAACIITSTRKAARPSTDNSNEAVAAADSNSSTSSNSGSSSSAYPATCHRMVVLECEQRNPRALLVRSIVGVTDRMRAVQPEQGKAVAPAAG